MTTRLCSLLKAVEVIAEHALCFSHHINTLCLSSDLHHHSKVQKNIQHKVQTTKFTPNPKFTASKINLEMSNQDSSISGHPMTQDLIYFLGPIDSTQYDGDDTEMDDASILSDESQFEDVFEDAAEILVPRSTPVDAGELDAILENFEADSDADKEYAPGDLPPNLPERLGRLVRHIPHDDPSCEDYRKFAVTLLKLLYGSGAPEDLQLLQQFAALLEQASPRIMCDMENLVTELVMSCLRNGDYMEFPLGEFMQDLIPNWGRQVMTWLAQMPDDVLENIFGTPVTGANLTHLLYHTWITVKKGPGKQVKVVMMLEDCGHSGYTPLASAKTVQKFVDTLPDVPLESLSKDDRTCGICRGAYTEDPSLVNGLPETAVRLPCGHVLGELCLTALLSPKPEGWGHRLCPLCRVVVPVLPRTLLGDFLEGDTRIQVELGVGGE